MSPNQIRLWLYIISADCWWGVLIICSQISPSLVWFVNSGCQPLDLTDHLLGYSSGHWKAVAFELCALLKGEQEEDASQKDSNSVWLIIQGNIWILVPFTWEPWLFVLYNQLSIYSVSHHWTVTGDVVVIYCRWQLTAERKVQLFESFCVVFSCTA